MYSQLTVNLVGCTWVTHHMTSATNCARLYNLTLSKGHQAPPDWAFNFELSSDNVYDGFVILSLLEDHERRNDTLKVPHTEGKVTHKCWVVVIDGVTIGCCCCGIHNCHIPLSSNHNRFCPEHKGRNFVCAIVGCEQPVVEGKLACAEDKHQAVERVHREHGQAQFQLKERLQRAHVAHPTNSDVVDSAMVDEDDGEEEEFIVEGGSAQPVEASQVKDGKVHAQFGRKRTHNEQIIVAPCGMIITHETFYGAEAVTSVIEMVKRTFHMPGSMPDHIFFDNNCQLAPIAKKEDIFKNVGLSVDVFHFNCKHSEKDTYCQENCNPNKLMSGWEGIIQYAGRWW